MLIEKVDQFYDSFRLTDAAPEGQSIYAKSTLDEQFKDLQPGVYNDGLLTICDDQLYGGDILAPYVDLVGRNAMVVAYTAFGDAFCICPEYRSFIYLYPGTNEALPNFSNFSRCLNHLMEDIDARSSILQIQRFHYVKAKLGRLRYGECFVNKVDYTNLYSKPDCFTKISHAFYLRN